MNSNTDTLITALMVVIGTALTVFLVLFIVVAILVYKLIKRFNKLSALSNKPLTIINQLILKNLVY